MAEKQSKNVIFLHKKPFKNPISLGMSVLGDCYACPI
jgi:hypothetical protein